MPTVRRPRKPGQHGRDHVTGGADPIPRDPRIIYYEFANDGEWLYIQTESHRTGSLPAIQLETNGTGLDSQILLNNGDSLLSITNLTARLQSEFIVMKLSDQDDANGNSFTISGVPDLPNLFKVRGTGRSTFGFRDGGSYVEVVNSDDDVIFKIDDDGTLHTRGPILADL